VDGIGAVPAAVPVPVLTPESPAVLPGPPEVDEVPVDPAVVPAVVPGAAIVADPAAAAGAAVPGAAIALFVPLLPDDAPEGVGTVGDPAAPAEIALLRTGVSPVVTPAAAPGPALWCD